MIYLSVLEEDGDHELMHGWGVWSDAFWGCLGARLISVTCLYAQGEAALFCGCSMADERLLN